MTHDGGPRTAPAVSSIDARTWKRSALRLGEGTRPPWPWLLPLALLPLLALGTWWGIAHIEDQVESTAPALLREAGIDTSGLTFEASYRDLEVGGVLPPGVDAARIGQVLGNSSSSDGADIRSVSIVASIGASPTEPEPSPATPTPPPPSTDASPPDELAPPTTAVPPPDSAEPTTLITVVYDGATVALEGIVATEAQSEELATSAAEVVGPDRVRNELTVDGSAPATSERLTVLAATITTFGNLTQAEAVLSTTNLDVTGTAANRRARRPTQAALLEARGLGLATDTDLRVEAASPMTLAEETAALGSELRGLQAEVAETIVFTSSSIALGPDARVTLDKVVDAMRRYPQPVVEVGGHTDTDGSSPFNELLSQTRADAVVAYLIARGIPADRLVAIGYGESRLLVDDSTEPGKRQNRRVEFVAKEAF
ncbi:MAG: OmpA family protein [Acidimicrobiales bacterium]|nr:OmpA family protein [Acidimicrobiales bacterium]